MPNFVTLSCPTCGARLQVGNDLQRFACAFCGNEHIVKREGGAVSLFPTLDGAERIQAGVDRTAIELTIARLEREIKACLDATSEIAGIKQEWWCHPKSSDRSVWHSAATYILQQRQATRQSSSISRFKSFWHGGCSISEANDMLYDLTIDDIDIALQWCAKEKSTGWPGMTRLVRDLERLRELEGLRSSLPEKQAELRNLQQMLKS